MPDLKINVMIAESGDLQSSAERIGERIRDAAGRGSGGSGGSRGKGGGSRNLLNAVGLPDPSDIEQEGERAVQSVNRINRRLQEAGSNGGLRSLESGVGRDIFRSFGLPFGTARGLGSLFSGANIAIATPLALIAGGAYLEYQDAQKKALAERTSGATANLLGLSGIVPELTSQFTPAATGSVRSFFGIPNSILPGDREAFSLKSLTAAADTEPSTRGVEQLALALQETAGRQGTDPSQTGAEISERVKGLKPSQQESLIPLFSNAALLAQREAAGVSTYPSWLANAPTARSEFLKGIAGQSQAAIGNEQERFQAGLSRTSEVSSLGLGARKEEATAKATFELAIARTRTAEAQEQLTDDPKSRADIAIGAAFDREQAQLSLIQSKHDALSDDSNSFADRAKKKQDDYNSKLKAFLEARNGEPIGTEEGFQKENPTLLPELEHAKQEAKKRKLALDDYDNIRDEEQRKVRGENVSTLDLIATRQQVEQRQTDLENIREAGSSTLSERAAAFNIPGRTRGEQFSEQFGDIAISRNTLEREIALDLKINPETGLPVAPQAAARLSLQRGVLNARERSIGRSENITIGEGILSGAEQDPLTIEANRLRARDQAETRGAQYRTQVATGYYRGDYSNNPYQAQAARNILGIGAGNNTGGQAEGALSKLTAAAEAAATALSKLTGVTPQGSGSGSDGGAPGARS